MKARLRECRGARAWLAPRPSAAFLLFLCKKTCFHLEAKIIFIFIFVLWLPTATIFRGISWTYSHFGENKIN